MKTFTEFLDSSHVTRHWKDDPEFPKFAEVWRKKWAEEECGGVFAGTMEVVGADRFYYILSGREMTVADARILQTGFFGYPPEGYSGPTYFDGHKAPLARTLWVATWSSRNTAE